MKNLNVLLICSLSLILIKCKDKEVNDSGMISDKIVRLRVDKPVSYANNYSAIFTNLTGLQLETTDDCIIGEILYLTKVGSELYLIHDISKKREILRFSLEGRFLNGIGKHGKGPAEIVDPRCFFIENEYIYVWSKLNISQFSTNGNFIRKVFDAYFSGVGLYKFNDSYFIYNGPTPPFMLTKYTSKGYLKESFIPFNYIDATSGNDKLFFYDDKVGLFCSVYDTIYTIKEGKPIPTAYFSYGINGSAGMALKQSGTIYEFVKKLEDRYVITNYFENSDFIFFEFAYSRKTDYCLYNKKLDKSVYFNSEILDDIKGTKFNPPICLTSDNCLVIPLYNYEISKNKRDKKGSDSVFCINDNPTLLFCKLKQIIYEN